MSMSTNTGVKPRVKHPTSGHLILSRRVGECITIGEHAHIVIRVLKVNPKGVIEFAIEAPKELPIWREELYHKMKAKGQSIQRRSRLKLTSQWEHPHVD